MTCPRARDPQSRRHPTVARPEIEDRLVPAEGQQWQKPGRPCRLGRGISAVVVGVPAGLHVDKDRRGSEIILSVGER